MKENDDFFQVNNEVPFQAIKSIKIESVQIKGEEIHIRSNMTLARGSQGQFITLVRHDRDIVWLLDNIVNSGQCALLPKADCSDMFSQLVKMMGGGQPLRVNKLKLLKERVLLRCLRLISTIVLEQIRMAQEHYQTPIFIFFHQNFALYHNPIYFKQEKVSLKTKMGKYIWEKYALFTGKGNSWEQLQNSKKYLMEERQRMSEVTIKLQQYVGQLHKLQEEFISEREVIKKRTIFVEELMLSFEMQLKYLDLVIEEAKETAARAEQQKNQCQKLVGNYGLLLAEEYQGALKGNQKLMTEFVKVICQNEDELRIAPY